MLRRLLGKVLPFIPTLSPPHPQSFDLLSIAIGANFLISSPTSAPRQPKFTFNSNLYLISLVLNLRRL